MLIYSSVDRYLGCYSFLAVMSNTAMNILIQLFVCHMFSFILSLYISEWNYQSYDNIMLNFFRYYQIVFQAIFWKMFIPFSILPAMCECSNFSTFSPILVINCLFDYSHLNRYEVISKFFPQNIKFYLKLKSCNETLEGNK